MASDIARNNYIGNESHSKTAVTTDNIIIPDNVTTTKI